MPVLLVHVHLVLGAVIALTLGREARWAHVWLRADASGVAPVTEPTRTYFGLGGGGFVAGLGELSPLVDLGGEVGYLFASRAPGSALSGPASLVAVGPIARLHGTRGARRFVFWAQASVNYVRTGELDRVGLGLGVGVSWMFSPTVALGPRFDYRQIFAMRGASFATADAGLLSFGLALEVGLFVPPPVPSRCPPDCPPLTSDADGDGVGDGEDRCPLQAGLPERAGCPDPDPDRDGVVGEADRCPLVAEDLDGHLDADGCPDLDDDGDGISDLNDACPGERGLASSGGCPDQDGDDVPDRLDQCPSVPGPRADGGCPHRAQVVVTQKKVELLRKLAFADGTSTLLPRSFALLDEVVQAVRDRAPLCLRIEGHTDGSGTAADNLKLSQRRADAVRAYLLSKGLAAPSLTAVGLGATVPLASNRKRAGRERNRRVEFVLVPCLERKEPAP